MLLLSLGSLLMLATATTLPVDIGYSSEELGVSDETTGYFEIAFDQRQYDHYTAAFNSEKSNWFEITYEKKVAGDQSVCVGLSENDNCWDGSVDYYSTLGASTSTEYETYCFPVPKDGEGGWLQDYSVFVSVAGICKASASTTPCYSTTDSSILGVRLFETGVEVSNNKTCVDVDDRYYLPILMDTVGQQTATYDVVVEDLYQYDPTNPTEDLGQRGFLAPSTVVSVPSGGKSLYVTLDVANSDDTDYAVSFHITPNCCNTRNSASFCTETCHWNATSTDGYIVYPDQLHHTPKKGDYTSGGISLTEGSWAITPYIYNLESSISTAHVRYCAGLGFECAAGSWVSPNILSLLAMIMLYALLA